jgi:pyruvate kinase
VLPSDDAERCERLGDELRVLRDRLLDAERGAADAIGRAHPVHRDSVINLAHYLALRRHDVRLLQRDLAALGLSSLGRSEPAVLPTIDAVLGVLDHLAGRPVTSSDLGAALDDADRRLASNAAALLGPAPSGRGTRIMVTLPSEAAADPALVDRIVASGMDVARVNTAHDSPATWLQMLDRVSASALAARRPITVAADLAGPKVRTGPLLPGPPVVRIRPERDRFGRVVTPARVRLVAAAAVETPVPDAAGGGAPGGRPLTVLPVDDPAWVGRRRVGDLIHVVDTRGSLRRWRVTESDGAGCEVEVEGTTYVMTGLQLEVVGVDDPTEIGSLPLTEAAHRVGTGDVIVLTRSLAPAPPAGVGEVHRIGCTFDAAFTSVRAGERVSFDDGRIDGMVRSVHHGEIVVEATEIRGAAAKLRAGKGINFPDSDLEAAALTPADLEALDVLAGRVDVVQLSFVRRPEDVHMVRRELVARDAADTGIVVKIENAAAFERLPELLVAAMEHRRVGVMIARGDLAVEIGFTRLAEVQEEILWLCEAAHVPVVWATEVLDSMARTGRPSRAEVTDAAMADRAECVMLNKGRHVAAAIEALHSILCRMQEHQHKKRSLLRRLRSWETSLG